VLKGEIKGHRKRPHKTRFPMPRKPGSVAIN
jgi:hypothetical protein